MGGIVKKQNLEPASTSKREHAIKAAKFYSQGSVAQRQSSRLLIGGSRFRNSPDLLLLVMDSLAGRQHAKDHHPLRQEGSELAT